MLQKNIYLVPVLAIALIACSLTSFRLDAQAAELMDDDLFAVSFPNQKEGWASGRFGTVLHTQDGGVSWMRQQTGTNYTLSSIYFTNEKEGWAVGDQGTILHTVNGGKTWEKQKSPVPYFLMKVYFVNEKKGWIVGERTHILTTDDGGRTWSVQFKADDQILKSVSFFNENIGWAVGESGFIFNTTDGGKSWQKQAGRFEVSEETGEIEGEPFLFDVVALSASHVWAVGIDGHVLMTIDGGKVWKRVETKGPKSPFFSIETDKRGTLVIAGEGIVLSSSDSGKTWTKVNTQPPITYSWIYGIAHQEKTSMFVGVGAEGSIYIGSSQGWRQVKK
jgi:photosystem II stability/assembly factor-like uncharacterized protein